MKKFFKDKAEKVFSRWATEEVYQQKKKDRQRSMTREPMTTTERETALKATLKVLNGEAVTEREEKQMRRYEKCYV